MRRTIRGPDTLGDTEKFPADIAQLSAGVRVQPQEFEYDIYDQDRATIMNNAKRA